MSGSGGDVSRVPTQTRGRRQHQKPSLPFDVMADIAACSDPATLVRFAATCREARRRVAEDDTFRRRLRLRHSDDRFLLPLLRGHFVGKFNYDYYPRREELWLVDTSAADATRLVKVRGDLLASSPNGKDLKGLVPLSSRGGLLLVRASTKQSDHEELLVCDPAARRSQILPRLQAVPFDGSRHCIAQPVLLVGDGETGGGEVGRPFLVLRATIVTSEDSRSKRCLEMRTFSPEAHGVWGAITKLATPNLLGTCTSYRSPCTPLVVDGVVHILCLTTSGSYVLMLNVRAKRVSLTTLPASFTRVTKQQHIRYLFATDSLRGNLIVLIAEHGQISMWVQSRHTKIWREQAERVITNEQILRFDNVVGDSLEGRPKTVHVDLLWFSETSGVVLFRIRQWSLFWLDLRSKKIIRCCSDPRVRSASQYCPYEIQLSSWVPNFSSRI